MARIVDCHAHIIDPDRFPFAEGAGYRPLSHERGTQETLEGALARHDVGHCLLVQPSCYGFDNRAMLHAMATSPGRFRGIAMVAPAVGEETLRKLAEAGVVGVRFNLLSYDAEALRHPDTTGLLERIAALGWFAEVVAPEAQWPAIAPLLLDSGVSILVDHFGMPAIPRGRDRDGFEAVLGLGRSGRAVVKLSTPHPLDLAREHWPLLDPIVAALLDSYGPERCVWGSDWPFLAAPEPPDYRDVLAFADRWLPDPEDRRRVLWDNPVRLFAFGAADHG